MSTKLIVARLRAGQTEAVAAAFRESDRTELPAMVGVSRRTLFQFHDLYFHLVESQRDIDRPLSAVLEHPLYREVSSTLEQYIAPYDPGWQRPADAMAVPFYSWSADEQAGAAAPGSR